MAMLGPSDLHPQSTWHPIRANDPASNALLLDLVDNSNFAPGPGAYGFVIAKERFHEALAHIAGCDAAVLWDRDIAPRLIDGDVPWSIHDGGDSDHRWPAQAQLHRCVRVYLMHSAAAWHREKKRWYWTKADGSNGHQTNHLLAIFESEIRCQP